MIKQNSKGSPALRYIERVLKNDKENISICFYALGFNKTIQNFDKSTHLFQNISNIPIEIKKLFSNGKTLEIGFRNVVIENEVVSLDSHV